MRFALLCDDPRVLPIIRALEARVDGHQLTHAVRTTAEADALLHGLSGVRFVGHWEDLLAANEFDAVIVGGNDVQILEGAKQLATARIPLLFVPFAEQGSTYIYELSLIRDDNRVDLWPLFWHRYDQAVIQLKKAIDDGELGRIQFLQLQRAISQASPGLPISQRIVDNELLHDVDLPRWLMGDYDQVTALRTAASSDGVQMQSVVLAGRSLPEANWSISSVAGPSEWKLTIRGEKGLAELRRVGDSQSWKYEFSDCRVEGDEQQTVRNVLSAFVASTPATDYHDSETRTVDSHGWGELVKCYETVDASHRSIRRRRTIELHFEPMSERAIFKTQMAATGCGLLIGTFLLTLCYLGIASLVPLPRGVLIGMRTVVFAPLVVFLFAQILLPLTRPSSAESARQIDSE